MLCTLHALRLVDGDFCPENLILTSDFKVFRIDLEALRNEFVPCHIKSPWVPQRLALNGTSDCGVDVHSIGVLMLSVLSSVVAHALDKYRYSERLAVVDDDGVTVCPNWTVIIPLIEHSAGRTGMCQLAVRMIVESETIDPSAIRDALKQLRLPLSELAPDLGSLCASKRVEQDDVEKSAPH
eukprot:TRINITY_DN8634_c0_g1_i1.p1 TRINITY_DN8634_c0_g1~~TRINITY_DN8634_c0_g1_i1.p1  ORF type:complete len:182 (+),score=29.34 TRINITY_DN8634_c0_g1_i1:55-600(+)